MYSHTAHLHSHKHTCTFPLSLANNPTQGKSAHELHGQACDTDSPLCIPRDQPLGLPSEFHCISDSKPHNRHSLSLLHTSQTTHGWARESWVACLALRASRTLWRK